MKRQKDREWRRSSREIYYVKTRMKDAEENHMAEMEDAEGRLKNAEERHMADKEDDASKIEELKRQLAGVKNELQARTGVVVVLGT